MNSEQILPFISVVVPAYNEEKYLPDCLKSLKEQTYPKNKYEIIVVDNNSTDRTRQVIESFGVRLVGCQAQGVANAREVGSRAASGEIIAGTDSDTILKEDWLEKIANKFSTQSALIGLTGQTYLAKTNPILASILYVLFGIFQMFNFALGKPTFSGFNFAVRKEFYEKVGGIDVSLVSAEDIDLSFKLVKVGKVKFFWDVLVFTSPRRLKKDPIGFFSHNMRNYFRVMSGQKPEGFKPIR